MKLSGPQFNSSKVIIHISLNYTPALDIVETDTVLIRDVTC